MDGTNWFGGRLVELAPDECQELLEAVDVARVAWCTSEGPVVLPVNFVARDGTIWIRTSPYTRLGREVQGELVAVQVDEADEYTRSGWSVLAQGRAEVLSAPEAKADPGWSVPEPWAGGPRTLVIRIEVERLSGRRLMAT